MLFAVVLLAAAAALTFKDPREFRSPRDVIVVPFQGKLDGAHAATVGGWFYPRRKGEQVWISRGTPEIGPLGERFFRPERDWVNFVVGTDQHGFLMGTINGNGAMPFVHVTVQEIPINTWNQVAVVKDAEGYQKFYVNGVLVHTDRESTWAPQIHPFRDTAAAEPIRVSMPLGGLAGEVWVHARELSADEIRQDFLAKRDRYKPAPEPHVVALREMDRSPVAGLWEQPLDATNWPGIRARIRAGMEAIFGVPPRDPWGHTERGSLEARILSEERLDGYVRRKVVIPVQQGDRMVAWLLVPDDIAVPDPRDKAPAVICFYGTTAGAGKDTTVGLSGPEPGTPPRKNAAFALDMVRAGFVALAPDWLRDGERIAPGRAPYDTTDFYERFPDWSIHGKDAWDTSRAIDYLQSLPFVDGTEIGMVGHSYGGHSTIFAAALDPRIRVAVANGPVSEFVHHGMHWAVPRGSQRSQSLPRLRPYILAHEPPPITFYEVTSLIAPRALLVGQAVGERRPFEEENYASVAEVYRALGVPERVRYHWYAGDHDFPPAARKAAIEWLERWFTASEPSHGVAK
ncbi:MAG: LamG-like jellyroll fold domain-containing protein [Vicinamibacteraceae bacterium]